MRMIVGVHEPWDHKLADSVENFISIVGPNLRRDPFDDSTADQKVGAVPG
jgi:hypothetical protein